MVSLFFWNFGQQHEELHPRGARKYRRPQVAAGFLVSMTNPHGWPATNRSSNVDTNSAIDC
jgi:hypothetical protein